MFAESLNRLAAIPTNALLVYLLLYGEWGLPRLELFGAGLATSTVNFAMFFAALWFAARRRPFRKYHVLGHIWRIDWPLMRQLVILGAPISISFLLEYGLFGAAGLLMGLISTTALAAHQIALQIAAILFMVPFGIGMAATVRVGHARRTPRCRGRAERAGSCRDRSRHRLHVRDDAGRDPWAICDCADFPRRRRRTPPPNSPRRLLLVGATFFIADGIQTIAAGSLRGMNDTRVPLLFATVSYWLIGFTLRLRPRLLDAIGARSASGSGFPAAPRGLCHSSPLALPAAGEQALGRHDRC